MNKEEPTVESIIIQALASQLNGWKNSASNLKSQLEALTASHKDLVAQTEERATELMRAEGDVRTSVDTDLKEGLRVKSEEKDYWHRVYEELGEKVQQKDKVIDSLRNEIGSLQDTIKKQYEQLAIKEQDVVDLVRLKDQLNVKLKNLEAQNTDLLSHLGGTTPPPAPLFAVGDTVEVEGSEGVISRIRNDIALVEVPNKLMEIRRHINSLKKIERFKVSDAVYVNNVGNGRIGKIENDVYTIGLCNGSIATYRAKDLKLIENKPSQPNIKLKEFDTVEFQYNGGPNDKGMVRIMSGNMVIITDGGSEVRMDDVINIKVLS